MKTHRFNFVWATNTPSQIGPNFRRWALIVVLLASGCSCFAQVTPEAQAPIAGSNASAGAPVTITLQDALQRARVNDPQYRSAVTDLGLAREDRVQARAGVLPNVAYNNSFIYTQGTGQPAVGSPKFIANNGGHEYISQADVHQSLSLTNVAE